MSSTGFPQGFLWGAATAAYQIEGGVHEDGRGESIWDHFSKKPGAIHNGDTGDVACDHYHRWRDDLECMRDLGLTAYRFSVAWPRVIPRGSGKVERKGLDFYEKLVDALLAARIEPALTLYHWDLPQALQDNGGWTNRDTASWFAEYAACLFTYLGDRVKIWMTLNEPQVAAFLGHAEGIHAPGLKDFGSAVQAAHVLLHGHALAVQAYRQLSPSAHRIGIALDLHPVYPFTDGISDIEASRIADGQANRWYLDPVLKGSYPDDVLAAYTRHHVAPRAQPGDFELLKACPVDFIGVNYYFPSRVYASDAGGILGFQQGQRKDCPRTDMGWEVYPEGLYDLLTRISREYENPVIMITENGAAYPDQRIENGQVQDQERIEYVSAHLREARRAIQDGVKLEGYFLWSLLDNFEWSSGYAKRFGITYVDFHTQARTWKASANWYQRVIAANGASL
ncbi:MAG: GH1 family beta-glucosidase [Spirochaetia bacterium]|jgi:beta-glucosidase